MGTWRTNSRSPNSGLQYSYDVDSGTPRWIYFLDPPGGLGMSALNMVLLSKRLTAAHRCDTLGCVPSCGGRYIFQLEVRETGDFFFTVFMRIYIYGERYKEIDMYVHVYIYICIHTNTISYMVVDSLPYRASTAVTGSHQN